MPLKDESTLHALIVGLRACHRHLARSKGPSGCSTADGNPSVKVTRSNAMKYSSTFFVCKCNTQMFFPLPVCKFRLTFWEHQVWCQVVSTVPQKVHSMLRSKIFKQFQIRIYISYLIMYYEEHKMVL